MPSAVLEKQDVNKTSEQIKVYRAPIALYEIGESFIVLVELPGADDKAIKLQLDKGVLTIEAPLKLDLPAGATPTYSELHLGNYRRTLDLGDRIEEEKIEASFKSGVLTVTMPKSKNARSRKIPIKTA